MTKMILSDVRKFGCMVVAGLAISLAPVSARADQGFRQWINQFYATAAKEGISRATYQKAFAGVSEPDPDALRKATFQPEFTTQIWDYLDSRVNPYTVRIGREMKMKHATTLNWIERNFNVDKHIILAIWSMESNYGAVLEKPERLHNIPQALATLGYSDPKRAKFARTQLIAALKILQAGDVTPKQLTGSWAGAMGHTQFIPTSYLLYAVDADGNGKRDIWRSIPDALATAANLLSKNGWQPGRTWGYETAVPRGGARYEGQTKTIAEWAKLGFTRPNGKNFTRGSDRAMLKLQGGANGPGFLMMKNFFTIKKYNASDSYALAVGLLADEIAGYGGMQQKWPRPDGTLDIREKFELQTRMKELGYYNGEVDGNFGSGSKAAISAIQSRMGMETDGQPSQRLLRALRN
ncbi:MULTISPECIES: lytic murein transglycosylase [Agrobacterium]|uniref:Lytic murein transglycosylase n=1 Tax=Agrobacterium salinitolerans TaxID=1183413 RepID=A0A9X3KRS3_9HYPH|nr:MULTISPECIES: lytic murein transglycosylase [Agrobacterium]MBA4774480.1 lytic murein transglycosylase [Hyphomicrobiales bacterium]PNQ23394.1 lytic murein transglycosylase [Rhizobium sp. YIC5082]MCZ7853459.1 lytic murein transglycosylase [Agrobacterium salinitolerans]MCZ7858795.1 lytic murein transglycosylase [Agrobacterium salinitolerans]MCZ7862096.1 lytic murein transglycosylase [Agrobacterium salinitolerans]